MTTQQNDTATLTDEQLEGVAGAGSESHFLRVGVRSSNPTPHPSPFVTRRPTVTSGRARIDIGPVGVVNPDSM